MNLMNRKNKRGTVAVEFVLVTVTLVPLLLGTFVVGINLIRTEMTEQLARDAGHMFGHGVNMAQTGNQSLLAYSGSALGLSATAGRGSAVVILSSVIYVDANQCADGGAVNGQGQPSGCTNLGQWVFNQRLVIGNSSVGSSKLGTPTGVTINSTTGQISPSDYVTKSGDVANFSSIQYYTDVGGVISGMPSGESVYVAEVLANGFTLPSLVSTTKTYSYAVL